MRFSAYAALTAALVSSPALAQNNQVLRGPVPEWVVQSDLLPVPDQASGLVFLRRQDSLVHLDGQGEAAFIGYRLKILHPTALQLGNIAITWNPAAGAPMVHAIRVYRDGQTIDVLAKSSFEILRREDQLEAAMLDGLLTATLRVPDLRVGDELEVAFTTRVNDPTLGKDSAGVLALVGKPAAGRYRIGLSWTEGQKPALKITPDITPIARNSDTGIDFRFDNPATVAPPNKAPARYMWQRAIEYSDFNDWPAISRRFATLFTTASTPASNSPIRTEAKRIAGTYADPMGRAAAALKLVQQDVRYVYIGLNSGNLTPASADETWSRRYGDCKGKTALLLALLRELGIAAEPVLVNASGGDDGLDQRLPSPKLFDHVLVRARIGGASYYLDGTLPVVAPPSPDPVYPLKWLLPVTVEGSALEQRQWTPATRPDEINLFAIDASKGFDVPSRIVSTTILRGIKGLGQYIQFSGLTPNDLLTGARQNWIGDTWQTIDDVQWRFDQKAQASILTISGTGKSDWQDDGRGARSLALPGGGFNPPERRIRSAEQNQDLPYANKPEYECRVTSVKLPGTSRAGQWSTKPEYDARIFGQNYYRAFALRGGTLRMIRGFRVEKDEIDAATARRDNDRVPAFDNSMAWVFYNPAGGEGPVGSGKPVPATDEIDWTADTVPCLSPATLSKPTAP